MSKAFVIKNKEGKYWCGNDIFSATIDIRKTYICEDFDFISEVINKLSSEGLLKDCEVVEITIAEDDLEQKIAVLERALKNTCRLLYGTYDEHYPNYFIEKAKKELKGEKDE